MRIFVIATLAVLYILGSDAQQLQRRSKTPNDSAAKAPGEEDVKFMKTMAIGNAAEIELGQMAQRKGVDANVRQFGAQMERDHSQAASRLASIAATQHVSLPDELDPPHKAVKSALSDHTGGQFDGDYIRTMVQEHSKTLQMVKREASASQDPVVRQYAQSLVPVVESHLQEAQQIEVTLRQK